MPGRNFSDIWNQLRAEVEKRNVRFASEYSAAWKDLLSLVRAAADTVQNEENAAIAPGDVSSLRDFLNGGGQRLAFGLIKSFRKIRPQARALAALDAHEAGLDDLVRRLPETVTISGLELIEALGSEHCSGVYAYWLRRRKEVELPLRSILRIHCLEEANRRARLDGGYFLVLAKVSLALLSPWQDLRRKALPAFAGQEVDDAEFEGNRRRWFLQMKAMEKRAEAILQRMALSEAKAADRLIQAVLHGKARISTRRDRKLVSKRQDYFRYWSRQQRAVLAVVDLEAHLGLLASDLLKSAGQALDELDAEHTGILNEMEAVIGWLESLQKEDGSTEFPPPSARLLSGADRAGSWRHAAEVAGREHLAIDIETIEPRRSLPGRRAPWRHVEPLNAFRSALSKTGHPIVLEGFRQAEAEHRSIVREIERSREVVTFSLETARAEPEAGSTIAREGMTNALALVDYQKRTAVAPRALAERRFVDAIATTLLFTHAHLEQSRLGLLTQLARQSGSRAVRTAWQLTLRQTAAGGRWIRDRIHSLYRWFLLKIGWETPPISTYAAVVARSYLGDVLDLQLGARDLPLIYRRLFRLEPVEDPRFLVGREAELTALAQARSLWHSKRAVSVLLVGARGSGKTSLLNCAVASVFFGETVIRSQFAKRITDRIAMREFLREQLQIPSGEDLVAALSSRRAVVILEELERTFLRRMNGFEGLKELLRIVSATSRTTLWILGLNQHSYGYLDAATGLGQHFSHKINAMAISPEHLKSAILLRHNLSGLRLQYPPVARSDPRVYRFRKMLGLHQNAEELFFDSLYRQSEGIFRSAFELWQHYMERAEGGVLYMKQPLEPDPEPLIAQFTLDDAFALQAILQHGSLADRDHAEVFECPIERSRIRLEKLLSLECLEEDPAGPGLRVRPEGGRIVHTALHRLNLL